MTSGATAHPSVPHLDSDAIVSHGFPFCSWYALRDGRGPVRVLKVMNGAPTLRSDVPLVRNMGGPTSRETHGPGVLVVPNGECCNGMTRTDRNVCRWLANHRPSDPVGGRAGEGEQVARWPGAVRYARCGTPKQDWLSSERCSEVVTGKRLEIERLTSRLGEGRWKSALR
jgi:hypothetical protein